MSTFNIGDRVAYYDIEDDRERIAHRTKGKIVSIIGDSGRAEFEPEWDKGATWPVHLKACRKLKPKRKPREFWVYSGALHCQYVGIHHEEPPQDPLDRTGRFIKFREVLK